jgi:DNA (cytosine-5)-methyltransferase 1
VSTFSGCGGSCTGYIQAGYDVLWANEFIPQAALTYTANHTGTIVDPTDIRELKASDILDATGLDVGDIDMMDGSPPCASFAIGGLRSAAWGQEKNYSGVKQRTDDLFFEYTRLLADLQPKTFIAENVLGLTRGAAVGYYNRIRAALTAAGYVVDAAIIDASRLGVPQARQRLIFVGVRAESPLRFVWPIPGPRTPMSTVFGPRARLSVWRRRGWDHYHADRPFPTVQASGVNGRGFSQFFLTGVPPMDTDPETGASLAVRFPASEDVWPGITKRLPTLGEMRAICGFPSDFVLTGTFHERWERMGRAVPPPVSRAISTALRTSVLDHWENR